jgi:hypothetical protein
VAEFYCQQCRKWNRGACCTGCLQIDPAQARFMFEWEIKREREKAMTSG